MTDLGQALDIIGRWDVILALFVGSIGGVAIGAIPGVGAAIAIAILLPATFAMKPIVGLTLLLGIYGSSMFGGAVPAVLINTPGTPVNALTTYDGYPMTRRGEAPRALSLAYGASFCGGVFSVVTLILLSPVLARIAPLFGSREIFLAALLGMVLVVVAHRGRSAAAGALLCFGIFLQTIGLHPSTYTKRFTFDQTFLASGVDLIVVVLGLFAISQAFALLVAREEKNASPKLDGGLFRGLREVFRFPQIVLPAASFGTIMGIIPGVGEFTAQFLSYTWAQKITKGPSRFGKGAPEGIIASEAANNAVPAAAMIPLLALGIPGEALTAMMLSVFYVHNVVPGPSLFTHHLDFVIALYICLLILNFLAHHLPDRRDEAVAQGHRHPEPLSGHGDPDPVLRRRLFAAQFRHRLPDRRGVRAARTDPEATRPPDGADHPRHGARPHHGDEVPVVPAANRYPARLHRPPDRRDHLRRHRLRARGPLLVAGTARRHKKRRRDAGPETATP